MIVNNKRKQVEEQFLREGSHTTYQETKGISMYEEPPQNIISLTDF